MLEKMIKYVQNNHQKFWLFIPFFLAFCCFINTLGNGFLYDDIFLVVKAAPVFENWTLENIKLLFKTDMWDFATSQLDEEGRKQSLYYRPVLMLELMIIYAYAGLSSWKWHLSSVLLHAFASMLTYQVINVSLEKTKIVTDKKQINRFSLFAAVVFAIHPLQSESVAWISALGSSLVAIKMLACMLFYLHIRDLPIKNKSFIVKLFLSLLIFFLALLTKEVAIVLLVLMLSYEVFLFQHKTFWNKDLLPIVVSAIAFLFVTFGYIVLRHLIIGNLDIKVLSPDFPEIDNLPFFVTLFTLPIVVISYLKILIYPFNLIPFYPIYHIYEPQLENFYIPLLIVLIFTISSLWFAWNNKLIRLGLIWLVLPVLPVLDIRLFLSENLIHDRYLYFSLIGAGLFLCQAVEWLNQWLSKKKVNQSPYLNQSLQPSLLITTLMIFLVMGSLSIKQNYVWENEWQFWSFIKEKFPNCCGATVDLGRLFFNDKLYDEAISYYEEAKRICPNSLRVHSSLGILYLRKGNFTEAENSIRRQMELALKPSTQVIACLNLGIVYELKGDKIQAIDCYQKALKLDPNSQKAKELLNNLEKKNN